MGMRAKGTDAWLDALLWASFIVPAVLFAGVAAFDYRHVFDGAEDNVRRTIDIMHEHALKVFETHALVIGQVERRIRGMSWDEIGRSDALRQELRRLDAELPQIASVWVIDPTGRVRSDSRGPAGDIAENVADRPFFLAQREADVGVFVGPVDRQPMAGVPSFTISHRRSSDRGTFDGVIAVSASTDYFLRFYESVAPPVKGVASIVRADGEFLARCPSLPPDKLLLRPDSALMKALAAADQGVFTGASPIDDVERIIAFRKLRDHPVYVMFGVAKSAVLARWFEHLAIYGAFFALAGLSLFGVTMVARRRARQQHLTTQRLERAEERLRAYFDHAAEALFIVKVTMDGRFILEAFNPAAERLSGIAREFVIGRQVDECMPPAVASVAIVKFRRCATVGEPMRYEETLDFPAGTRTFETMLVPIRSAGGRIVRILGSARDVTEQRQLSEQLRQAQKMEAIGQLTGGVAHDFNNLLTVIAGNMELIEARAGGDHQLLKLVAPVVRAVERGEALIRHLLAFSRRQTLRPELVDLNALLRDTTKLLSRALRGDIRVEVRPAAAGLLPVRVDQAQLEAAIINIAVNARDAMPDGGTLRIETGETMLRGDGPLEGLVGEFVWLAIADTGCGMDRRTLERSFEPFFTTKPVGKGTGLGLSQVYGFAKQSGGGVTIASEPDNGTVVTLYFPKAVTAAAVAPRLTDAEAPPATGRGNVLVVEDDTDVAALASAILERLGYRTVAVNDAEEALAQLATGHGIDLVFADLVMPGPTTGLGLARAIRRQHPHLPIVLTTGYGEGAGQAEAEGFVVVPKPYRAAGLAEVLARALGARAPTTASTADP